MAIGEGNTLYFPGGPSGAGPAADGPAGRDLALEGARVPRPKALASSWLACGVSRSAFQSPEAADSVTHSHGSRCCVHRATKGWGMGECLTATL